MGKREGEMRGYGRMKDIYIRSKIQNSKFLLRGGDEYVILFDKRAKTFVQKYSGY